MSDSASLFSTTATLIDQPVPATAAGNEDAHPADGQSALGPTEQCWAVLVTSHDFFRADTQLMTRVGFPAEYQRGSQPGASQAGLAKKRLQVQFPLKTLADDRIVYEPEVSTVEQLLQARQASGSSVGGRRTIFHLIGEDMAGVQKRVMTAEGLTLLFNGPDVQNSTLFYPPHVVLQTPHWAAPSSGKKSFFSSLRKSASAAPAAAPAFAQASVKWATCFFTSPAPPGSVDLQDDRESRAERERIILDRLKTGETNEAILARLRTPSKEHQKMLKELLRHLERRGVIWGQAGQMTKPSLLNFDPSVRPQFVVQGLYPEPFLDRCKAYCHAGGSIGGKNCMQAEASEPAKSPKAPLITSCVAADDDGHDQDLLQGWHVKVILEPYQTGSPLSTMSATPMMGILASGGI